MQNTMERLKVWVKKPRTKKRIYVLMVVAVLLWVAYRFIMINVENRMFVFNPARYSAEVGTVVETMNVQKKSGVLKEPLTVKNNRASVASSRVALFKPGQKVGSGTIKYVAENIDLDTGLYVITTQGVKDGLNFVDYNTKGFFVPSYALVGDKAFVVDNGVASARNVKIEHADSDMSVITSGLKDGDVLILSRVVDGQKVQVKKLGEK